MLSNATVPILGAVDTGVVGQLGQAAPIGAVGIGAIILTFFYWMFGFLRMGTSGLTAQAIGERDRDEVSALLIRGLLIGAAAGVLFIALQVPLFWLGFQLSPASAEVERLAQNYMEIRIWGAPAAIAAYAMTGWLIAAERTREVLVLQLVINGVNVVLDLWFVLGLGWGVEGVAVATLIAEWTGLALGLWMCREVFAGTAWRDRALIFAPERLKRMAAVNGDIMVRSILLEIGFAAFLFKAADFDDVTLAANQILMQFMHITAYALDGFAFSAEALVGQALGARARSTLRRAAVLTSQWGFVCVAVLSVGFLLGGGQIIEWMTTAEDVRIVANDYLFWMALAPLIGLPAWMLDGIFIGATRTRDMRNAMLTAVPIYLVAMFALTAFWGNHGLWLSMLLFFGLRGLTLAVRYPALEASADAPARPDLR
ncbi:MAG: MATE family efflux transporter [Pikeienuella sp.]